MKIKVYGRSKEIDVIEVKDGKVPTIENILNSLPKDEDNYYYNEFDEAEIKFEFDHEIVQLMYHILNEKTFDGWIGYTEIDEVEEKVFYDAYDEMTDTVIIKEDGALTTHEFSHEYPRTDTKSGNPITIDFEFVEKEIDNEYEIVSYRIK